MYKREKFKVFWLTVNVIAMIELFTFPNVRHVNRFKIGCNDLL